MILKDTTSGEISHILDCCSKLLSDDDRSLMKMISIIRSSLDEKAVEEFPLIEVKPNGSTELKYQSDLERRQTIQRLVKYRNLIHDPSAQRYSIHPSIRTYYQKLLEENAPLAIAVHKFLFRYYIDEQIDQIISLDHVTPLIEAIHHACKCGLYSEAWSVYTKRINVSGSHMLTGQFGACDTALSILREFFPEGDLKKGPNLLISDEKTSQILGEVGYCLMSLGYLESALSAFERENAIDRNIKYRIGISNGYPNLSKLYIYLGELKLATKAARKGIEAADHTRADHKEITRHKINSMCTLAWALHLRGFITASRGLFQKAKKLNSDIGNGDILTKFRGFFYASHLMMTGNFQEARIISESNLDNTKDLVQISQYRRIIGDLDAAEGKYDHAAENYDLALKVARNISQKDVLIEALLSHSRFVVKNLDDIRTVYSDLSEALKYAMDCGYRIYEIDVRYSLACAFLADNNIPASKDEALYASQISRSIGYYWGKEAHKKFQNI